MGLLGDPFSNEQYLMAEFRRGKSKAFETIHARYHGAIKYFAAKYVGRHEAEDIASDTFVKLWHLKENFEKLEKVKAFLYLTAKNACLNHNKRDSMKAEKHEQMAHELSEEEANNNFEYNLLDAEFLRHTYQYLQRLPKQQRRVMELHWQGMSTEQIANVLNLSPQTVRNTWSRAVETLKKYRGWIFCISVLRTILHHL